MKIAPASCRSPLRSAENMKIIPIIFLALCVICSAETADEIAQKTIPGFVGFDNGLDRTPEGRRKAALNNAEFYLELYMASDKVPEGVRISYALSKLREQMRGSMFKGGDRTNGGDFAFAVDQKGHLVVDEEQTRIMRDNLAKKIKILEKRLTEIYDPHKAEQDAPGATASRA